MQKALVTGGAGFLGSHLCDALIASGHTVIAVDNFETGLSENLARHIGTKGFELVEADCRNKSVMLEAAQNCNVIYHLAARVGVDRVLDSALRTLEDNLSCTQAVAEVALQSKCQFVYASTSEVYGRNERVPFREEDDLTVGPPGIGRWSYAASKIVDEHYVAAMHREMGLNAVILRLFNSVGPRQRPEFGMVLPRFIVAALNDVNLEIFGDGNQKRCFTWCADTVRGLMAAGGGRLDFGEVYNVGSTEEISIRELAEMVIDVAGGGRIKHTPFQARGVNFSDMQRRIPDISRISGACGWKPEVGLNEMVKRTVEWWHNRK